MEENVIIELFWQRSEKAIAATAEKYEPYLYKIAYNILQNDEDTKECVNDTYLGAWNSMPPHRPNRLSAFLGKITRNLSINRFKLYNSQKRGGGQTAVALLELDECIPASGNVEQAVEDKILVSAIEKFLYSQPLLKRNIFIRRYWYISSVADIAKDYNMSESKITSLLYRMRIDLKKQLETEDIVV